MRAKRVGLLAALSATAWAGEFSTFIGDTSEYKVARIVADAAGNTYVGGSRGLTGGGFEVFVMKLDATGQIVLFNTLSGKGSDMVNDVALDGVGNVYVAGATTSTELPLHGPYQNSSGPGFIAKFSADLGQVLYATYFPAAIQALAVDAAGNMYVTGTTNLSSYPVTAGLPAGPVSVGLGSASGAFVTKLSAAGDHVIYSALMSGGNKPCGCCSSCFTSPRNTVGVSITVDAGGNAYFAGNTDTSNIPTTAGAFLSTGTGAFVGKINAAGTAMVYLTYIGATNFPLSPNTNAANIARAVAVDTAGNAYVTGSTFDPSFPATPGAYQTTLAGPGASGYLGGPADAFVAKLNPSGTAMVWATYLGGAGVDSADAMVLDGSGNAWVVGTTASADFPNAQGWSSGGNFVAAVSASGAKLAYVARYPSGASSQSLAMDGSGTVHLAGPEGLVSTLIPGGTPVSRIFGVGNAAYGLIGGQFTGGEVISIYGPHIGLTPPVTVPPSNGAMPTGIPGLQVQAIYESALGAQPMPVPLLYVSDSQINAVVPSFLSGLVGLRVVKGGSSTPDFPLASVAAVPEIFRNADGSAVAVNQDGSYNSQSNPATAGSTVSIWTTGVGFFGGTAAGKIAVSARDLHCCSVEMGQGTYVSYAGDTPGTVAGVIQINFAIPPLAPGFTYPLAAPITVTANGTSSNSATVWVGQ